MIHDPDVFLKKAKQAIVETDTFTADDLYIVWFCKILGNWKALISTDAVDNHYWEVTYNGAKKETYVDLYTKVSNSVLVD